MKENKGLIDNYEVVYQWKIQEVVVVGEWNGRLRKTSPIIKLTPKQVETENSVYDLGTPKNVV